MQRGPRARSLDLAYTAGGCDGAARAAVTETATSIRIVVRLVNRSGPGVVCPAIERCGRLRVRLRAAIDGRRVLGARRVGAWCGRPARTQTTPSAVLAPSLIGLAPADARAVLRADGMPVRTSGSGRRVVTQRPAPGRPTRGAVTLRLGG